MLLTLQSPPRFGESQRSEACDLAIKSGGEFVDHDAPRRFRDHSGDSGAEFLADAEYVKWAKPRGNIAEADGGECRCDGVEVAVRSDCVNDGPVVRPVVIEVGDRDVRPELSANRTFPEPDGPTITPMRQAVSSEGSSAERSKLQPLSALKRDFTRAAR